MKKNLKQMIVFGVLGFAVLFIYGRNFFKSLPPSERGADDVSLEAEIDSSDIIVSSSTLYEDKGVSEERSVHGWGRDPFIEGASGNISDTDERISQRKTAKLLYGIALNENRRFAIINGQVLQEGDMIDGERVVKICREYVILEIDNKRYVLNLRPEES